MPDITVDEFAKDVGVSVKRIQEQLVEAGLSNKNADDVITDKEKKKLLSFLRQKHGKMAEKASVKLHYAVKLLVN